MLVYAHACVFIVYAHACVFKIVSAVLSYIFGWSIVRVCTHVYVKLQLLSSTLPVEH
jgi:hypothetical protein